MKIEKITQRVKDKTLEGQPYTLPDPRLRTYVPKGTPVQDFTAVTSYEGVVVGGVRSIGLFAFSGY